MRAVLFVAFVVVCGVSPALADDGRFRPVPLGEADYTALRDVVRVVVKPTSRAAVETSGAALCAFDQGGRVVCAGGGLGRRFPEAAAAPSLATPCFGDDEVFGEGGLAIVALDLAADTCAMTKGGRVYCSESLTPPMLRTADGGVDGAVRAVAMTNGAIVYADADGLQTMRTRVSLERDFGPKRRITNVPTRVVALTQASDDAYCLLGEDGHVYCTDEVEQDEMSAVRPDAPVVFHRVSAAGPMWGTAAEMCEGAACAGSLREPLSGVVELVAVGRFYHCALSRDGQVACWESPRQRPWRMPRFTAPTSIAASRSGLCALTRKGTVECVGFELLEDGPIAPLAEVKGLVGVRQIALGDEVLCAVTKGGRVDCRFILPRPVPEPATIGDEDEVAEVEPRWTSAVGRPAVAILGWTRDLTKLVFAGSYYELDEATSPLIGVTTRGELIGARAPGEKARAGEAGGVDEGGSSDKVEAVELLSGLPCVRVAGQTWCRALDESGDAWTPWRAVSGPATGLPWWVAGLAQQEDPAGADDMAAILTRAGRVPVEVIAWDDIPCVRFADGGVACLRRGVRTELVSVLAPKEAPGDVCTSVVAPRGETMRGVIDLDGDHGTACVLLENRDIACWGYLGTLEGGAYTGIERRWVPRVVGRVEGAVSIAVSQSLVCALTAAGEVWCVGSAGEGRAPGRWGGFGTSPQKVVGLGGVTGLAALPGHTLVCAWSTPDVRDGGTRVAGTAGRKDPREDPNGAVTEALAAGRAVCWGDEATLRDLNATFVGKPRRR